MPTQELFRCPLCGAHDGYILSEGNTFRWWNLHCAGCGCHIAECRSDQSTHKITDYPKEWPAADAAWNDAGKYVNDLLNELDRYQNEKLLANQELIKILSNIPIWDKSRNKT